MNKLVEVTSIGSDMGIVLDVDIGTAVGAVRGVVVPGGGLLGL